jgi:hypothetical protein
MTFKTEFPDFPEVDFPATIPSGFKDSSSHNDAMPSLFNDALDLRIWIDYADVAQRETSDGNQFTVVFERDNLTLFQSDDWDGVLSYLNSLQNA